MSFFDRLFGRQPTAAPAPRRAAGRRPTRTPDEQAIERYRYLLRTAPPETIEEAHAEAFAQLTPEQRQQVLQELTSTLPAHERTAGVEQANDPRSLARLATRAEARQPGTLERSFGGMGGGMGGMGMGGMLGGSFLSSIAGVMVGSAIANQFFNDSGYDEGYENGANADGGDGSDGGDVAEGDTGDSGGFESGTDTGDLGSGDFGGGDFGGGDFGGGDF